MSEITGQDEARRALTVDQQKLLDALTYFRPHWATNGPVMLTPDKMREHLAVIEGTLRHFAEAALRAPSLDRGAEEMRKACLKAAAGASYGPPSSWPGDFPRGWRHPPNWDEDRTPTPTEAAWHDNGARDAWFAIRALPVPADLNEGGGK